MIQLKNVTVQFSKKIFCNAEIKIPDGKITAITGESGCGKTTMLYLLGLLSSNRDYEYLYHGRKLDLTDREESRRLAREEFGFLFQERSLIDTLTIAENMIQFAALAGKSLSKEHIKELLEEVDLDIDPENTYPGQLSGGEQQRAALAAILAKEPCCIFADEPTSALDRTNTQKIIDIFGRLTRRGITVVIATHSDKLCEAADCVYQIKNRTVSLEKGRIEDAKEKPSDNKGSIHYGLKERLRYIRNSYKKGRVLKGIIIFFCAVAIAGFSLVNSVMDYLKDYQEGMLNQISEREIFVVNQAGPDDLVRDADGNPSMSDADIVALADMNGVEAISPFYEFRSFNLVNENRMLSSEAEVKTEKGTQTCLFSLETEKQTYFVVQPYHNNQKIGQQVEKTFDVPETEEKIYLSHEMAEALGVTEADGPVTIRVTVSVPVRKVHSEIITDGVKYPAEYDMGKYTELELQVAGFLSPDVINRYSINGNCVIYMPVEMMEEIRKEVTVATTGMLGDAVTEWNPSAYLVYGESYNGIGVLRNKINSINNGFITRSDYQDTAGMDQLVAGIQSSSNVVLGIIMFIIFVLMAAVFISQTMARRREFALLKANGMSDGMLVKMMTLESLWQGAVILLISLMISVTLSMVGSYLLLSMVTFFTGKTIAYVAVASILFVLAPTLACIALTLRVQPDRILRS